MRRYITSVIAAILCIIAILVWTGIPQSNKSDLNELVKRGQFSKVKELLENGINVDVPIVKKSGHSIIMNLIYLIMVILELFPHIKLQYIKMGQQLTL